MPNHIKNIIHIKADPARIQEILLEIQNDEEGIGSFDFNKLIFQPESLDIESGSRTKEGFNLYRSFLQESKALSIYNLINNIPENKADEAVTALLEKYRKLTENDPELMTLGEKSYNNVVHYGAPTWYEWSNANWGTKWNAYNFDKYDGGASISFSTAWNSVPKILVALSQKYPDVQFDYAWADEDIGYNVGKSTYLNGETIDSYIPVGGSREAYELAAEISDGDLAEDYSLYLSKDETTYEYREDCDCDEDLEV